MDSAAGFIHIEIQRTVVIIITLTAVISIALSLTKKDDYTMLYKINKNVCIKTTKIINYIVIVFLLRMHTHACVHRRNVMRGEGE